MNVILGLFLIAGTAATADPDNSEIETLARKVKSFHVVRLPSAPGQLTCGPEDSLTVDMLRGVELDDNPPVLGKPAVPYEPGQSDGCRPGEAPYIARGILPFRFRHFLTEFNYGGWHNMEMQDYAAAHGFRVIFPYVRDLEKNAGHLPERTHWLKWGGYNWDEFKSKRGIPSDRLDRLVDADPVKALIAEGFDKNKPPLELLMIDIEYAPLSPADLRKQPWYPKDGTDADKTAFEKKYYAGYALSYTAPAEAARQQGGWKSIGIYGWQPFNKTWFGLENAKVDPATYWPWNAYGKQIYEAYDTLYPDVYVYYPSPQNVASTLANIDLCMKFVRSAGVQKPMRPYYWTLLHGGDADRHWWSNQPLLNEEVRAMTAMCFFTGSDGCVLWNWSEFDNHHAPPPLTYRKGNAEVGNDVMLRSNLKAKAEGRGGGLRTFHRYDVLHIITVGAPADPVRFQPVGNPTRENHYGFKDYKFDPEEPVYRVSRSEFQRHLRPLSEPIAAMVEGLALVKPLEDILRHGEVKIDVPAQRQFAEMLPIVRRVRSGKIHVLITYDPTAVYGARPRSIELRDFDNRSGVTVRITADAQTRIFVLQED